MFEKIFKSGQCYWEEPCYLCNEWIQEGEVFYNIIMTNEERKIYGLKNFIVHKGEWDEFKKDLSCREVLLKLQNYKKPRRKPMAKDKLDSIECFKKACEEYGFNKYTISKNRRFVKAKKDKKSSTLVYDIIFDRIDYKTKSNRGLIESMFDCEFVAKVRNSYCNHKGVDKCDDFTVANILEKAEKETDKLIRK